MNGMQGVEFCGFASTGERFRIRWAFLFSFKDHKIAHEIRICDFTGMPPQQGVLKAKPAF